MACALAPCSRSRSSFPKGAPAVRAVGLAGDLVVAAAVLLVIGPPPRGARPPPGSSPSARCSMRSPAWRPTPSPPRWAPTPGAWRRCSAPPSASRLAAPPPPPAPHGALAVLALVVWALFWPIADLGLVAAPPIRRSPPAITGRCSRSCEARTGGAPVRLGDSAHRTLGGRRVAPPVALARGWERQLDNGRRRALLLGAPRAGAIALALARRWPTSPCPTSVSTTPGWPSGRCWEGVPPFLAEVWRPRTGACTRCALTPAREPAGAAPRLGSDR